MTGQLSFSLYLDSAHLLGHFQFPQKSGHTQGFHEFSLKKNSPKLLGGRQCHRTGHITGHVITGHIPLPTVSPDYRTLLSAHRYAECQLLS